MPAILHLNHTWEHSLTDILNHDPKPQMGIIMRAWVKDNDMEDFRTMLAYTADKFTPTDDPDFDHPLSEHKWLLQTRGKFMKYVINTLSDGIESRPISNQKQKLVSFKKGIKREETVYPTLKDERNFDGFSRSLSLLSHMNVNKC